MDGAETIIHEDNSPGQKNKCRIFLSFVNAGFESSDMCVSFGIPIEVREELGGPGWQLSREERQNTQVYLIKRHTGTGKVKLG